MIKSYAASAIIDLSNSKYDHACLTIHDSSDDSMTSISLLILYRPEEESEVPQELLDKYVHYVGTFTEPGVYDPDGLSYNCYCDQDIEDLDGMSEVILYNLVSQSNHHAYRATVGTKSNVIEANLICSNDHTENSTRRSLMKYHTYIDMNLSPDGYSYFLSEDKHPEYLFKGGTEEEAAKLLKKMCDHQKKMVDSLKY